LNRRAWSLLLLTMLTLLAQSAAPEVWAAGLVAGLPPPAYLLPSQADMLDLLPPPPLPDSLAQRQDLQAVIEAQRMARHDGTVAHAVADADLNCSHIAEVLGDDAAVSHDARVLALINQAAREGASLSGPVKSRYRRTRPFAASSEVEGLADMGASAHNSQETSSLDTGAGTVPASAPTADLRHSSYPSGHSTFGTVCAILLADMVPEQREALFRRGLDYAHSRMVVGAHFPTDLESGRLTGTVAVQLLMQNPRFQRDFEMARGSLRADLHLPAEPVEQP
jgi:acid phosphatase (class A)